MEDSDDWLVKIILLTKSIGKDKAKEIVEKIESES